MSGTNETEIEVKFYLSEPGKLAQRLREVSAQLTRPRTLERNFRFDTPDGRLSQNRQVLRLRQDDRVWLTYKSSGAVREDVTIRQEIEFEASDAVAARHFLEALGYQVSIRYEKFRTVYTMPGLTVTLDEMPYGDFCELEGESGEVIESAANELGLDWSCRILISYLAIFDALKRVGFTRAQDLVFAEFAEHKPGQADFQAIGILPADS